MGKFLYISLTLGLFVSSCSPALKIPAPSEIKIVDDSLKNFDILKLGPFEIAEYEYSSGAYYDEDIITLSNANNFKTDVRGRIYLPQGNGPFPLVVFLHGNHQTCGTVTGPGNPRVDQSVLFTNSSSCPVGTIEAPSYRGYDASARLLASWGYAVASINANRGITGQTIYNAIDSSYVLARGNLVLRHIEELAKWSREGKNDFIKAEGLDLTHKLDLSKVGLMGHSRGGEGVRFAYNLFTTEPSASKWKDRIPGLKFLGIFEIGPVDVGTNGGRDKIEAAGVAWNVLIPGCDYDVADFSGVRPFERMLKNMNDGYPKSVFTLWGANHNFFNSEWQVSDAPHICVGNQTPLWNVNADRLPPPYTYLDAQARAQLVGSETQITVEKGLMMAFFRGHLGSKADQQLAHIFDPQYRMPDQLAELSTSSREYFLATASKLVFNPESSLSDTSIEGELSVLTLKDHIAKQIESLTLGLQAYQGLIHSSLRKYRAELAEGSLIRPAIAIVGKGNSEGQTVVLPFSELQSASGYWTLDMAMAVKKSCNHFIKDIVLDCPAEPVDETFEVALVLGDGTVTSTVNIQDYIALGNWYSNYFQKAGVYTESAGKIVVSFQYVPILYQTARFELSDFGVTDQEIKAVQFKFKSGNDVSLIVQSMRLAKRP